MPACRPSYVVETVRRSSSQSVSLPRPLLVGLGGMVTPIGRSDRPRAWRFLAPWWVARVMLKHPPGRFRPKHETDYA